MQLALCHEVGARVQAHWPPTTEGYVANWELVSPEDSVWYDATVTKVDGAGTNATYSLLYSDGGEADGVGAAHISPYVALNDQTPAQIASALSLSLPQLLADNSERYVDLSARSKLKPGTQLLLHSQCRQKRKATVNCRARQQQQRTAQLALCHEVGARVQAHWPPTTEGYVANWELVSPEDSVWYDATVTKVDGAGTNATYSLLYSDGGEADGVGAAHISPYVALNDQTPAQIASALSLSLPQLLADNSERYVDLSARSKLKPGTQLLLHSQCRQKRKAMVNCRARQQQQRTAQLALCHEVGARVQAHWPPTTEGYVANWELVSPEDSVWYDATVTKVDGAGTNATYSLLYSDGGEADGVGAAHISPYVALNDQTPAQIASALSLSLPQLLADNSERYVDLSARSKLKPGTQLLLHSDSTALLVGRAVRRKFPGYGVHLGMVVGHGSMHANSTPFVVVEYEDGEEGHLSLVDLQRCLLPSSTNLRIFAHQPKVYSSTATVPSSTHSCTICMSEFARLPIGTNVMRLPRCHHFFCKSCVEAWWRESTSNSCPTCRTVYSGMRRCAIFVTSGQ